MARWLDGLAKAGWQALTGQTDDGNENANEETEQIPGGSNTKGEIQQKPEAGSCQRPKFTMQKQSIGLKTVRPKKDGSYEDASDIWKLWLQHWVGGKADRKKVLDKVESLRDVVDLTVDDINEWAASEKAKIEMHRLRKVVKSKLNGPVKIATFAGKTTQLYPGKREETSFLDVSLLDRCFVSLVESDYTISGDSFSKDASHNWNGPTIESVVIHNIADLWNKIGKSESDTVISVVKELRGLEKLAWLPVFGNKEITTCLVTIKYQTPFKNKSQEGKRKPGETHEVHAMRSYKRVFIVLKIWESNVEIPDFKIEDVEEECELGSSSIYTFLTKNEITYELGFATDGKNDITSDVKENMTIQYLMKNVKETYEFLAKPCSGMTVTADKYGRKKMLNHIFELQRAIKELEEFKETAIYKNNIVDDSELNEHHQNMKDLQNALNESALMRPEGKHRTEYERLMGRNEEMKRKMTSAILKKLRAPSSRPRIDKTGEKSINVILIGKTGSGKSATGSLLLGRPVFKQSGSLTSQTKPEDIKVCEIEVEGITFRIMDTPGLFDTQKQQYPFILAIERIANEFPEGVHAIIYVMNGDSRFTAEEANTVEIVKEHNGEEQFNYAALLVTRGNKLFQQKDMTVEKYISDIENDSNLGTFQILINSIDKRVIFIENNDQSSLLKDIQRHCVFQLIREIAAENPKPYQREAWQTMRNLRQIGGEGKPKIPEMISAVAPDLLEKYPEKLSGWLEGMDGVEAFKLLIRRHSPLQKGEKELLLQYIDANPVAIRSLVKESKQKNEDGKDYGHYICSKVQIRNKMREMLLERLPPSFQGHGNSGTVSEYHIILENIVKDLKKDGSIDDKSLHEVKDEMSEILKELKCFPSSACVVTKNGEKPLSDVKVGDYVLSACPNGDISYSPVVMFSHKDEGLEGLYVNITTEDNMNIALSHNHLLHEGQIGDLKEARLIRPGDVVFIIKNGRAVPDKVTNVELVFMRGAICPHTATGNIIVNGVVASCYTSLVYPWLAHLLMTPLRLFHKIAPESVFQNIVLHDTQKGVPVPLLKLRDLFL